LGASLSSIHSLIECFNNEIDGNQLAGEELQCIMQYKMEMKQLASYMQGVAELCRYILFWPKKFWCIQGVYDVKWQLWMAKILD